MQKETRNLYNERKEIEKMKVLFALMEESRTSDRQLSKILGMSKTTVTRRRQELEKEGYIKKYTLIPNFEKIGIGILAFSFSYVSPKLFLPEMLPENRKWFNGIPEIIFCQQAEGENTNLFTLHFHTTYESLLDFLGKVRRQQDFTFTVQPEKSAGSGTRPEYFDWEYMTHGRSEHRMFIVGTGKGTILKPFSFQGIESLILPSTTRPPLSRKSLKARL